MTEHPWSFAAGRAGGGRSELPRDPAVDRSRHLRGLFQRIAEWLRPGGHLLATLGNRDVDHVDDFLGAPLLTSSYAPEVNRRLLVDAGLTVLTDEVVTWYQGNVTYQWLVATKPLD
jgi:hypothetical protein